MIHHVAVGPRDAVADADPIPHFSAEVDMDSADVVDPVATEVDGSG